MCSAEAVRPPKPGGAIMSATIPAFTSADSALVLIDHQNGTMQLSKNIPLAVVKRNALALAKVAKVLNLPVGPDQLPGREFPNRARHVHRLPPTPSARSSHGIV